jgi:holo-[acyl-carrier protein] synthase
VFTQEEQDYCFSKSNPFPHLAARFAAKEAVSKSFSTGIGKLFSWTSCSIYHGPRMQPLVRLDEQGKALLKSLGATEVRITLSHTKTTAVAVAALVNQ